jgi:tRNA(Glu) U13 pseudouridine synthase TruD
MTEIKQYEWYTVGAFTTSDWHVAVEIAKKELTNVSVVAIKRYVFNDYVSTFYFNNERVLNGY